MTRHWTYPTIETLEQAHEFLLARLGPDDLVEALGTSHPHCVVAGDLPRFAGPMVAILREWFGGAVSDELKRIAKQHRADYMREYMRTRRTDPDEAKRIRERQNKRRAAIRDRVREYDRKLYQANKRDVLARREQRRRESALMELGQIAIRVKKDDSDTI